MYIQKVQRKVLNKRNFKGLFVKFKDCGSKIICESLRKCVEWPFFMKMDSPTEHSWRYSLQDFSCTQYRFLILFPSKIFMHTIDIYRHYGHIATFFNSTAFTATYATKVLTFIFDGPEPLVVTNVVEDRRV